MIKREMNIPRAVELGLITYPRRTLEIIQYGTAGFRAKADILDHVLYRMGLLAVLRSKSKKGKVIGLMITASHNPEEDNGVKLIDPLGEMLDQSWEDHATRLANCSDSELESEILQIMNTENIDADITATVFVGQDTRSSSGALARAAMSGVGALYGLVKDCGIVSTPMVHYFVLCYNSGQSYGEPSEKGYFMKISLAFKTLRRYNPPVNSKYKPNLIYDGANGVGAIKMKECIRYLSGTLNVTLCNASNENLNHMCGADYVKMQQRAPVGIPNEVDVRCVSVDGDADRIVYYYTDKDLKFHLLDGDRIASLFAGYLKELLEKSNLSLKLGLVQTAYANGNSTNYITKTLKVPVVCVPTGVKHLHHKATEYDIGVYFEANGHGTVVFSETARRSIDRAQDNRSLPQEVRTAVDKLSAFMNVINQTVGDAITDLLAVESVLYERGWDVQDWKEAYSDLPNRQLKVVVKDREIVKTTDAERQCTSPDGLQDKINALVETFPEARAFVRPSGTENIVRIYAESDTQSNADKLAALVASAVYELAGGIGDPPKVAS